MPLSISACPVHANHVLVWSHNFGKPVSETIQDTLKNIHLQAHMVAHFILIMLSCLIACACISGASKVHTHIHWLHAVMHI